MREPLVTGLRCAQVNVWVHVADPSSFAWHSKEFMAPVIAPAEAELAWRPLLPSFDDKAACSLYAPPPARYP